MKNVYRFPPLRNGTNHQIVVTGRKTKMKLRKEVSEFMEKSKRVDFIVIVRSLLLVAIFAVGIISSMGSADLMSTPGKFFKGLGTGQDEGMQLSQSYVDRVGKLSKKDLKQGLKSLDRRINKLQKNIDRQAGKLDRIQERKLKHLKMMSEGCTETEKPPDTIKYKALREKRYKALERLIELEVNLEEYSLKKEYVLSELKARAAK